MAIMAAVEDQNAAGGPDQYCTFDFGGGGGVPSGSGGTSVLVALAASVQVMARPLVVRAALLVLALVAKF